MNSCDHMKFTRRALMGVLLSVVPVAGVVATEGHEKHQNTHHIQESEQSSNAVTDNQLFLNDERDSKSHASIDHDSMDHEMDHSQAGTEHGQEAKKHEHH